MHVPRYFSPLKRAARPRPLAAFDTEGTGEPGSFVCGAVVSDQGKLQFTDPVEMLAYLTSSDLRGYWSFAHNLEYDLGVLTSGDLRPFSCVFTDTRMLWAETQDDHGHKWRFLDSGNLFPGHRLEELGSLVGMYKVDLHPRLFDHLKAGKSLYDLPRNDQLQVLNYNLRDAEILYLVLCLFQEELLSLGGQLQSTIAGCSMDLFRRGYLVEPWPVLEPGFNDLARMAYYGARTEPYRLGRVKGVNCYDVSSLYPSVQADAAFPHPGSLTMELGSAWASSRLEYPGIVQASVEIPDTPAPTLPARVNDRLFFPYGQVTGVWTHNELLYALDNGVRLIGVDWSLFSLVSFNPFVDFIQDLYAKKLLYASSSDIREHTFKLLLNSAYGRYGINLDRPLTILTPLIPPVDWDKYAGGELRLINGWPYDLSPAPRRNYPAYANSLIAAYVTAGGRVRMHGEIQSHYADLCYTDTDSLWLQGEMEEKDGLGEMRKIHDNLDLWVVAPKEYAAFRDEALVLAHAKGIPESQMEYYLLYGKAAFDSPVGIREAAVRGLQPAVWINRLKERHFQYPKRPPDLRVGFQESYWPTRPWEFAEIRSLVETGFPGPQRGQYSPEDLQAGFQSLAVALSGSKR
jgi:hypothetical protein